MCYQNKKYSSQQIFLGEAYNFLNDPRTSKCYSQNMCIKNEKAKKKKICFKKYLLRTGSNIFANSCLLINKNRNNTRYIRKSFAEKHFIFKNLPKINYWSLIKCLVLS